MASKKKFRENLYCQRARIKKEEGIVIVNAKKCEVVRHTKTGRGVTQSEIENVNLVFNED